jgi:hypothetical protein
LGVWRNEQIKPLDASMMPTGLGEHDVAIGECLSHRITLAVGLTEELQRSVLQRSPFSNEALFDDQT